MLVNSFLCVCEFLSLSLQFSLVLALVPVPLLCFSAFCVCSVSQHVLKKEKTFKQYKKKKQLMCYSHKCWSCRYFFLVFNLSFSSSAALLMWQTLTWWRTTCLSSNMASYCDPKFYTWYYTWYVPIKYFDFRNILLFRLCLLKTCAKGNQTSTRSLYSTCNQSAKTCLLL